MVQGISEYILKFFFSVKKWMFYRVLCEFFNAQVWPIITLELFVLFGLFILILIVLLMKLLVLFVLVLFFPNSQIVSTSKIESWLAIHATHPCLTFDLVHALLLLTHG